MIVNEIKYEMSSKNINNISSVWTYTNSGKAKEILKKHGLYRSKNIELTLPILKALCGKGGVLRLLDNAWLSKDNISYFHSMVKLILTNYRNLKLDKMLDTTYEDIYEEEIEELKKLINDFGDLIKSSQELNKFTKQIRNLNSAINSLTVARGLENFSARSYSMSQSQSVLAMCSDACHSIAAEMNAESLSQQIIRAREERDILVDKKKQIWNQLDTINEKIEKLIKNNNFKLRDLENMEKNLKKFCNICNELGEDYYDRKLNNVGWLSFEVNKLKLETARILAELHV